MTRTSRANHPHAAVRDRAVARNGRDRAMPKGGSGAHNWGSFKDERNLESLAAEDEYFEEDYDGMDNAPVSQSSQRNNQKATANDLASTAQYGKVKEDVYILTTGSNTTTLQK